MLIYINSLKTLSLPFKTIRHIILIIFILFIPYTSYSEDMGGSLIRDYPVALPLPEGRFEFSLDYLDMGELTDIYDAQNGYVEDMQGIRMHFNYGLFKDTTVQSSIIYRNLDYGSSMTKIYSTDISFKQMLTTRRYSRAPFASLDLGFRFDYADEMEYNEENDINRALNMFRPGFNVKMDDEYVWFERNNGEVSEKISREGRPGLQINTQDMYDISPYLRLTAGKILGNFFPNLYVEYGNNYIFSKSSSSLNEYLPESFSNTISGLPEDIDRTENYLKGGFCILLKFPYKAMAHFEYNYIRLFRDDELGNLVNDNHIIRTDMNFFLTRRLVFNMGGVYYHRQFNGVIPFLNNEYTQSTFDDRYGRMHIGITYIFGG